MTLVDLDGRSCLVIACDSCGAVGEKEADVLRCPPFYVGAYTARVALLEVLCAGARVVSVADAICCEMRDTGAEIIRGIRHEMTKLGLDPGLLTGSTEENFKTAMTGLGITVIGVADAGALRFRPGNEGDCLLLVGKPKMGGEVVLDGDEEIASYRQVSALLQSDGVLEIAPVGSKGVAYECAQLALLSGREWIETDSGIDLKKSAGPATCVVALVSPALAAEAGDRGIIVGRLGGLLPRT